MKNNSVRFKTMSMKARLANILRTELYPYSKVEWLIRSGKKKALTDKEKIELFDKFWNETVLMDMELKAYKAKRKEKARIQKLREEKSKLQKA